MRRAPVSDDEKQEVDPRLDQIPKLPRAKLFGRMSMVSLTRIGMFGTLFVAIILMRKPCADGVANFIGSFDPKDAGPAEESSDSPVPGYELMTAEEALKRWPDRPVEDAGTAPDVDGGPGGQAPSAPTSRSRER